MKKTLCVVLAALLVAAMLPLTALGEEAGKVRVGISWVGDFEDGVPDEDTQAYIDTVIMAGGEPVYMPQVFDEATATEALKDVDCLILTGGEDIDPKYYGEEPDALLETVNEPRDTSDFALAKAALAIDMPILATCRGFQLINVVFGGTLVQDINTYCDTDIQHRDPEEIDFTYHTITIEQPDSLIGQAMGGAGEFEVNSWHHQAAKDIGEGLVVTAVTPDSMAEALEMAEPDQFMLAVQFHPEWHVVEGNEDFLVFFQMLMDAAEMADAAA